MLCSQLAAITKDSKLERDETTNKSDHWEHVSDPRSAFCCVSHVYSGEVDNNRTGLLGHRKY